MGKDKDDIFFTFGKIHGLENLAFADADELSATEGNPVKLQQLVDRLGDEHDFTRFDSEEHLISQMNESLDAYKKQIEKMQVSSAD